MTETKDIEKRREGPIANIRDFLENVDVKSRLENILGKRAAAFGNSIVNVVSGSQQLKDIARNNPGSIMRAAFKAATLNLPIDPALGQAAIVPYGKEAVFQIMYRGLIQLCIRSNQYAAMHHTEIYADEIKYHDPITGKVEFNDRSEFKIRYQGDRDMHVVGHYFYFRLTSGFEVSGYISHKEALAHAKKYSKAYQYDLSKGKKTSAWSTNPIEMGNKTIIIKMLKLYGIMSIEMQDAMIADRETFDEAQERTTKRIKSEQGSDPIDVDFETPPEEPETDPKEAAARKAKAEKEKKKLAAAAKRAEAKKSVKKSAKKDKDKKPVYHCYAGPHDFDDPNDTRETNEGTEWQCPKCLSWRVRKAWPFESM